MGDAIKENFYVKQKRYCRTMRDFEWDCQRFLKANLTYMDGRFEDTLEIPADGGRYIGGILQKQAALVVKRFQMTFLFNANS